MSRDFDDSSSSALKALATAASIARSDASRAGTPTQDGDNSSISSNAQKSDYASSNDDASADGPVITKAKSGSISNDESAKTIGSLLKKADAASNYGSQKRKSQNYSSSSSSSSSSDSDEDNGESEEFLISRIPKPKRPMTAYNFFFQAERRKIIRDEEEARKNTKNSSASSGTRRQSKGSNHQASFENMGKTIGRRWKEVNKEDLERYQALGAKESRRYKREMKVYNAKVASIRAKKTLRAEAKKMRREYHPDTRKAPSSVNSITDTNTTATLSTRGTQREEGDVLTNFINSLSQDQLKQLLRIRDGNSKPLAHSLLQSPPLQPQPQSIPAQRANQVQSTTSPASLPVANPAYLPPSSSSQSQFIGPMERALIHAQGQMIAQLQAQVQALQRQKISQASLSPPLIHQQHQQNGQMWSNTANSASDDTGMRLPTNAPLRHPMGNDTSRLTAAALSSSYSAAALSSSYSGTLAGQQQQQQQQQQQANPFSGNAAPGNNATSLFFGL